MEQDYREFIRSSMDKIKRLLDKRGSIQEFLSDIVQMVSEQMQSSVCSVYLHDSHTDMLILRATQGLNPSLINTFQLKSGEGIVGNSFKESIPLRVEYAKHSPYFLPVRDSFEEQYTSFLAVPIRRAGQPIGVISLQHEKADYFTVQNGFVLRAIASNLSAVLEDVEILMKASNDSADQITDREFSGKGVGQGIYIGTGRVINHEHTFSSKVHKIASQNIDIDVTKELTRFARSLQRTKEELEDIQVSLTNSIDEVADLIFTAHLLMLRDTSFSDAMQEIITQGNYAEYAIKVIVKKYIDLFSNQSNPRIQEKVQDLTDLANRLLRNLNVSPENLQYDYSGQIIILANTFPSEIVRFAAGKVKAIVVFGGGETAHIALLAKSLNLPLMFIHDPSIFELKNSFSIIMDLEGKKLFINPDRKLLDWYTEKQQSISSLSVVEVVVPERTRTQDEKSINILANVNLVQDVHTAVQNKAEGIGLYRSEFPFLVRNDFLSEEEQIEIYSKIIKNMGRKKVIIRTLDIGGDKLFGINPHAEENPFLGFRGIRFSLRNKEIFIEQIRAILRSAHGGNIGILFPMISSLEEFIEARNIVYKCMEELQKEGLSFCEDPDFGAMIEVPSAVEISGELSEVCNFLSIGTNDLIMYMLAVDRTNEMVGDLFVPHHPAILSVIHRLTENIGSKISSLSICGEAGANYALIPFFLGLGIHTLSVEPNKISGLKKYISKINVKKTIQIADHMLSLKTRSNIESFLHEEILSEKFIGESPIPKFHYG